MTPIVAHASMGPSLADIVAMLRPTIRVNDDGSFVAPKDEALADLITLALSMELSLRTFGAVRLPAEKERT